jgi:hypothetical protein
MRIVRIVAVLLIGCALCGQTVRVSFVGCESGGQAEILAAPKQADEVVSVTQSVARRLAYYMASVAPGVLAPRGWNCVGFYGSSGGELLIVPQSLKGTSVFTRRAEITGAAIELVESSGGTGSGDFEIAQVLARVFPKQSAFVQREMEMLDQPERWLTFGPYPKDELIVQNDRLVEFQTPPNAEGLGSTNTRLAANDDPIDGVAIWEGPKPNRQPDLLLLRVRLPPELRGLTSPIIRQFEREHQ